jgi:TolB-like protein
MPEDRRHIAVMFTDIVGYTALMGSDEDKAFDILKRNHTIHATLIKKHNGKLIKEIGDGTLASFPLASDAVRCAMDIQKEAKSQNIPLKIGIHEGEMVMAGEDVLGDGVNVASRLQEISADGSITISGRVYSDVKNKAGIKTKFIGDKRLKNVDDPVKVYKVLWEVEKEKPDEGQEVKSKIKLLYYVIAGIVVVLVAVILWQLLPTKETSPPLTEIVDKSIAVLPFTDMSPDKDQEYFSDGMMDAILMHLYKIGDLEVTSRTSTMRYKETDKLIGEIANELGVKHILEGSVSKAGNKVRIIAQLIDANNDKHLWAETYEQELADVFAIQSEVAQKIASSLKAALTSEVKGRIDKIPTENLEAYEYYLKGEEALWQVWKTFSRSILDESIKYYEKAIDLDADFSLAYAGLGRAYWHLSEFALAYEKPELYEKQRSILNKAIKLDPYNGWAYGAMWEVNIMWDWDSSAARRNLDVAMKLAPNDFRVLEANFILELKLKNCDKLKSISESIKRLDDNVENPLSRWNLLIMLCQKQFTEIAQIGNEYWDGDIELHIHSYCVLFWSYVIINDFIAATKMVTWLKDHYERKMPYYTMNAILKAREGNKDVALIMCDSLDYLSATQSAYVSNEVLATIQAAMGNKEEMYEYLNKAIEAREDLNDFMFFPFIPELIDCQDDVEFQRIQREIWIPRE